MCNVLPLQQIVGGKYLCTSYFSGLLSPHIPPRPSPPECRIDDVEWPLGFFFTTFSIRQRDNDHGYFALLLLHLAQMVLGLEHQGLTWILYKIRQLLHPPGWSRRRGWQWWQARSDTPQGPTHRWEGARFFPHARSWLVTTLGHAEKGVQQGGLLNKYLIWSKWLEIRE